MKFFPQNILFHTLILGIAVLLMSPTSTWALGKENCLPDEPGCVEPPPTNAEWPGPPSFLKYRLDSRANRWAFAWRSQDDINPNKTWARDTYDPDYVHPAYFGATFRDQCQTELDFDYYNNDDQTVDLSKLSIYRWYVDGVLQIAEGSCTIEHLKLKGQGIHDVKLEVYKPGASIAYATRQRTVRVRDYLVVLFGDSASSGEGSPDAARSGNNEYGVWTDRRCHRSAQAGVPKAVQKMEDEDPYTSITFLNFACSGATISLPEVGKGTGIIGPYSGIEPPVNATPEGNPTNYQINFLPSQIDQLFFALSCPDGTGGSVGTAGADCGLRSGDAARDVDMMFMTGGINDVQFANLIMACILEGNCQNTVSDFYNYADDAVHSTIDWELGAFADLIPDRYVSFKEVMDYKGLNVANTYVLEYPNAFTDENGNICDKIVEDVLPSSSVNQLLFNPVVAPFHPLILTSMPYLAQELGVDGGDLFAILGRAISGGLKVDADEVKWMNDVGTPTLNGAVKTGVEDVNLNYPFANFHFVDGIAAKFYKHGYCASDNWIRRATQSSARQGPWNFVSKPLAPVPPPILALGIQAETKGLMHPTDKGYDAIAEVLAPTMGQLLNAAPVAKADLYKIDNGATLVTNPFNSVLFNDNDPNGDEIRAVLIAGQGPKHGTVTLTYGGDLTYIPDANFKNGLDNMYYYVTDGVEKSSATKITVHVGELKFLPPSQPQRWNWDYPEGEKAPTVAIGGVVEFPVCNFCGDKVLRMNPELLPEYGSVSFLKIDDRWVGRYGQNGEIPPLLPHLDKFSIQIGIAYRGVFQVEGSANLGVYIQGEHPMDWSWVFANPEVVSLNNPTAFDLCDSCSGLVVRVDRAPEYGTVLLTSDPVRGRWIATYELSASPFPPTSDYFSVEIGEQNERNDFRVLGVARVSLSFID